MRKDSFMPVCRPRATAPTRHTGFGAAEKNKES